MKNVKVSSVVDEVVWQDLKDLANETHHNISDLLTEAIANYVRQHRVRLEVSSHLDDSVKTNKELGKLLAK